jgi:hypothetical protein
MNIEDERTFIEAARKHAIQLRHGNATQIALADMIDQMADAYEEMLTESQDEQWRTGGAEE